MNQEKDKYRHPPLIFYTEVFFVFFLFCYLYIDFGPIQGSVRGPHYITADTMSHLSRKTITIVTIIDPEIFLTVNSQNTAPGCGVISTSDSNVFREESLAASSFLMN